jgi:hypothetical protein
VFVEDLEGMDGSGDDGVASEEASLLKERNL